MAAWLARAALAWWCASALAEPAAAQRFGDRLAPRVPAVPAAYAPRHAPSPHRLPEYEDSYDPGLDYEEPAPSDPAPPPPPAPPPRRPTRTEAHRLEMSTEYFMVPERVSLAPAAVPRPPSTAAPRPAVPPVGNSTVRVEAGGGAWGGGALRPEPWAVPVLALACTCMLVIGAFEVFVVVGASRRAPSHRHLLLGQTLLFGLFSCAATAALIATAPTAFSCGAVRFGTGVAYVIVFASLLVKCVFLLSLNGGVYLPAAYQGLLLFFAVMIQVAIGAQWVGGSPPRVVAGGPEGGGARCDAGLAELLLSLCYAAFLIAVVCGVALRSRGIRDNWREAWHIAGAGGAAAGVWVCWVAAALGAAERLRDACVAGGLLGTCACVFALMFAPKGRRRAALGREGRWDADREEALSSLGAGGSGYSPSFFHFKPVKYGMVAAAAAPPADRKEPPAQPADPYGMFANSPHLHSRVLYSPPHYPLHPPFHYPYNYPPYPYLLPPGVMTRGEEPANVYTTVEPTFSSNPNVYFQRSEPLHAGMMY